MKFVIAGLLSLLVSSPALADVITVKGRVAGGMTNPKLGPMGTLLNEKGQVIYITGVISVLAPSELDRSCIYSFSLIPDKSVEHKAFKLVPPMKKLSCGHNFPGSR